jgi:hypothetical protein
MSEVLAIVHLNKVIDKTLNPIHYDFLENNIPFAVFYYAIAEGQGGEILASVSDCLVIDDSNKHLYPEYLI